jgi:hypothetical protein
MPAGKDTSADVATIRAVAWASAALTGLAVLGLFVVPSMRLIFIVMLVFAVAAVPQVFVAFRPRPRRGRHGR